MNGLIDSEIRKDFRYTLHTRVKNFLTSKNVEFKQIRVDEDPMGYMELKEKTNHQTVPQIFVDGQFIGGAKEFFEWMPG